MLNSLLHTRAERMCTDNMLLSTTAVLQHHMPVLKSARNNPMMMAIPDSSAELNDSLHACHTALDLIIPLPRLLGRGEVAPVHRLGRCTLWLAPP